MLVTCTLKTVYQHIHGDVLDLTERFGEGVWRVGELFFVINGQLN